MNKKIFVTLAFVLMLAVGAMPASANYTCTGQVTTVWLSPIGGVGVTGVGGLNAGGICQIGNTVNGWSSDACKTLYSQLLIARSTGAPITLWFNDNLTCTTQPSWAYMTGLYYVSQ